MRTVGRGVKADLGFCPTVTIGVFLEHSNFYQSVFAASGAKPFRVPLAMSGSVVDPVIFHFEHPVLSWIDFLVPELQIKMEIKNSDLCMVNIKFLYS